MKITRYTEFRDGMAGCFCEMSEDANGEFVSYEAYESLQQQLDASRAENEDIKASYEVMLTHAKELRAELISAFGQAQEALEQLGVLRRQLGKVKKLWGDMHREKHGLCNPRERRACTKCNAHEDMAKVVETLPSYEEVAGDE